MACALQVIHLVRDPRARYHSLQKSKKDFENAVRVFDDSCRWEMEDLAIQKLLPPEK